MTIESTSTVTSKQCRSNIDRIGHGEPAGGLRKPSIAMDPFHPSSNPPWRPVTPMLLSCCFIDQMMKPDGTDWGDGKGRAPGRDYAAYRRRGWNDAWWLFPGHRLTEAQVERLVRESRFVLGGIISDYIPTKHPGRCQLCGVETEELTGESALVDAEGSAILVSGQQSDAMSAGMRRTVYGQEEAPGLDRADPLVTRFQLGQGWVVVSMPYYGLCHENLLLAECVRHALDHLIRPLLLASINGPPIQYHVNQLDDGGLIIGMVNSSTEVWKGTVQLTSFIRGKVEVQGIWNGANMATWAEAGIPTFSAEIAPFSFGIFKVKQVS